MSSIFHIAEIAEQIITLVIHDWNPTSHGDWPCLERTRSPKAGRYAAVSRGWQAVIERETFESLRLDLDRLSQSNAIITPSRRAYVRSIQLDIVVPGAARLSSNETDEEALKSNSALQDTFEAFLDCLGSWSKDQVHHKGVKLSFDAYALCDPKRRGEWMPDSPTAPWRREIWWHRHGNSVLELTDPERIAEFPPVLAIVQVEAIRTDERRYISPVAICTLLARLTRAKSASFAYVERNRIPNVRNELAKALSLVEHPMDTLEISGTTFVYIIDMPPISATASCSGEEAEEDDLSLSLHNFSHRLKVLELNDLVVGNEFFFPLKLSPNMVAPRWNRLESLYLNYTPITPSGDLLFLPDPTLPDLNSQSSRHTEHSLPSPTVDDRLAFFVAAPIMKQFYLAAGRAALQMPVLKSMWLGAGLNTGAEHEFDYSVTESTARALWRSNFGYAPDGEILECWRNVSEKYGKGELLVEVIDEPNGS